MILTVSLRMVSRPRSRNFAQDAVRWMAVRPSASATGACARQRRSIPCAEPAGRLRRRWSGPAALKSLGTAAGCAGGNRSGAPHRLRSGSRMKPMISQANMSQMPESQTSLLLPARAFVHVPMLAGKICEPEKSMFRVSRDTFREWDRRAQEAGYGDNWRRTHEEREETRGRVLAGRLDRDLWIFA